MNNKFKCAAVVAVLLMATPCSARQALTLDFSNRATSAFVMVEPGAPKRPAQERSDSGIAGILADSFDGMNEPEAEYAVSELDGLYVPSWMRGGGSNPFVLPDLPRRSYTPPVSCEAPLYRPHPALGAQAERRRALYFDRMVAAACSAGVPVPLFDALVMQESRYNPRARSPVGAMGMAQLMPGTARYLGVGNAWDVDQNLRGGARYLREQLDSFGGWRLALAAYNAGPGNVRKHGRKVPPFRETQNYVRTILSTVNRGTVSLATVPPNPTRRRAYLVSLK